MTIVLPLSLARWLSGGKENWQGHSHKAFSLRQLRRSTFPSSPDLPLIEARPRHFALPSLRRHRARPAAKPVQLGQRRAKSGPSIEEAEKSCLRRGQRIWEMQVVVMRARHLPRRPKGCEQRRRAKQASSGDNPPQMLSTRTGPAKCRRCHTLPHAASHKCELLEPPPGPARFAASRQVEAARAAMGDASGRRSAETNAMPFRPRACSGSGRRGSCPAPVAMPWQADSG